MSRQLSGALLECRRGALACGWHARALYPRLNFHGLCHALAWWPRAMPFAGWLPTSAKKMLVGVAGRGGAAVRGAVAARNDVSSIRKVPVGVGLRRPPSNHAVDLPVRPVTPVAKCATGAPVRPAGHRGC
jgi:hypothetical protein